MGSSLGGGFDTERTGLERKALPGEFLDALSRDLRASANISSVFGSPVERGGTTVIPVARARWGMGGGGGNRGAGFDQRAPAANESRTGSGGGGGGGIVVEPAGYIEISGGRSRFRAIRHRGQLLAAARLLALATAMRAVSFFIAERRTRRR